MEREFINPPELASPPANLYNHVVKVGNTVYIAGQVPRGLDGRAVHVGDAAAQIRQVWANLETAVKAAGRNAAGHREDHHLRRGIGEPGQDPAGADDVTAGGGPPDQHDGGGCWPS